MQNLLLSLAALFAFIIAKADDGTVSLTRFDRVWGDKNYASELYAIFKNSTANSQIVYFSFDVEFPDRPGEIGRISRCIEIPAKSDWHESIGVDYSKYPNDREAQITKYSAFKIDEIVPFSRGAEDGNWPELFSHYRVKAYNRSKSRRPFLFRVSKVPSTEEVFNAEKGEITQSVVELDLRFDFVRKKDAPQLVVDSVYRLVQAKKVEKPDITLAGGIFYEQERDEQGFYHDKPKGIHFMIRGHFPATKFGPNGIYGAESPERMIQFGSNGIGFYLLNIDLPKLNIRALNSKTLETLR